MEELKIILQYIAAPILGLVAFLLKKHMARLDDLDDRVREIETSTEVMKSKLDDMKQDIHEIKKGVERLIDRRG